MPHGMMLPGDAVPPNAVPLNAAALEVGRLWACVPDETSRQTTDLARRLLKARWATLSSFTTARQVTVCSSRLSEFGEEVPLPCSLCRQVATAGTAIAAEAVAEHAAFTDVSPASGIASYAGTPIKLASGRIMGTLCVSDSVPHRWSGADLDILSVLAAGISNAVDLRLEILRSEAATAASRHEQERFLALADAIPGLVFERRKIGPAQAAYSFFGTRKRMLAATRELTQHGDRAALTFVHPDDRDFVRAAFSRSTAEETDLDVTFRAVTPGPQQRWLRSQLKRRRAKDGAVSWAGLCSDVTDLIAAREDAEAERAGRERAFADASHDIRTPLQAILGSTGFLANETRPDVIAAHAKTIRSASEAVLAIVNQMLDPAKSDVGGHSGESVDVRDFAQTCLDLIVPQARAKDIATRLVVEEEVPAQSSMNPQKAQQALLNLLNNAVKFTDAGAVTLHVATAAAGLCFSVTDTGIGVPIEKRALLFQRHSRLEADGRPTEGAGLGLSIAKELVEREGGRIGLDTGPSGGTVFWFELPSATLELPADAPAAQHKTAPDRTAPDRTAQYETAQEATETAEEPATQKPASEEPAAPEPALAERPTGGARILLADDLDLNRKLIADMLSFEGHSVDCVADGAAAVQAVRERSYDLILMDMIMPGMDGTAATRAIRLLPEPACRVPIVALTAHSLREQLEACLAAGMDDTLTKPLSMASLTSTVDSWTRGRTKAA